MAAQNSEFVRVWALRLSLAIMAIVVLLSWVNEIKLLDILVRAGISFGGMFLLLAGTWKLFEKTAPSSLAEEAAETTSERGSLVDFSVGDDETQVTQARDSAFPGQVDSSLGNGIPDGKQQAEIVRRMGWE